MAETALSSFTALLESIPGWIADLEEILNSATERQNEVLFENQPADPQPVIIRRRSKSSSQKSHRTSDKSEAARDKKAGTPEPTLLRPQLPHMTPSDALRFAQRKRKTASVCSGNQSGPSKYRTRSMVVIYYDGDVQKRFEKLVRAIGACRSDVRKGRMAAKVDGLSRTGSSSSEGSSSSNSGDETLVLEKLGYRTITRYRQVGLLGKDGATEPFDKVDGLLDKGQSMCERAAHQVLRDGDCAQELTTAKEHLAEAKTVAEAELPNLEKRVEKAAERQRRSNERRRIDEEANKKTQQAKTSSTEQILASFIPSDGTLEVDLEAEGSDEDEDDDEDCEFDLKGYDMGNFQMRSSRVLAH